MRAISLLVLPSFVGAHRERQLVLRRTYITYYYRWVVPQALNGNWCDLGTVSDSVSSPTTGYTVTQSYHKHHFAQCIPSPWGMTYWRDTYPWVEADVYGNGGYASNAGT